MSLLPDVTSLKIWSLSVAQTDYLSEEEVEFLSFQSTKRQITKIYLQKMTKIEDVYMLYLICPRINYLEINCIDYEALEAMVGLILTAIKNHSNSILQSLCLCIATADDDMIKSLEKFIHVQNLRADFTIKYEQAKICLELK